jgi:hypothetical protein
MGGDILDLYRDYLLASTRKATATGLSGLVDGTMSHDQITRFLAGKEPDEKALWLKMKGLIHRYENWEGCLIFDDTIIEKAFIDENEIVCRHYDRSKGRSVKMKMSVLPYKLNLKNPNLAKTVQLYNFFFLRVIVFNANPVIS